MAGLEPEGRPEIETHPLPFLLVGIDPLAAGGDDVGQPEQIAGDRTERRTAKLADVGSAAGGGVMVAAAGGADLGRRPLRALFAEMKLSFSTTYLDPSW